MRNKVTSLFLLILSICFIISFFIVFIYFIKYANIGQFVAQESYSNKHDWIWAIGIFIAVMMGFYNYITICLDLFEESFKKEKRR